MWSVLEAETKTKFHVIYRFTFYVKFQKLGTAKVTIIINNYCVLTLGVEDRTRIVLVAFVWVHIKL